MTNPNKIKLMKIHYVNPEKMLFYIADGSPPELSCGRKFRSVNNITFTVSEATCKKCLKEINDTSK